jgi:hypothetical protein
MASTIPAAELDFDLATDSVRALNQRLHESIPAGGRITVRNPGGQHAIAVGIDGPWEVEIDGHVGYYCAGMNQHATVRIRGNCGVAGDDQQAATSGRPRRLAGAALDDHRPGHHVLGHPDAAVAAHQHRGALVHAGAVVADVAVDLDL